MVSKTSPMMLLLALLLSLSLLTPQLATAQAEKPEPFVRHFSPQQKGEVSADEILVAIEQGRDIDVEYAVITGALDIAKIELPVETGADGVKRRVIKGGISIRFSEFLDVVDFRRAQFSGAANFSGAQFSGKAIFRRAQFIGDAIFRKAQFSEEAKADFWEAQFRGNADFFGAQFSGAANFRGAQFSGDAYFELAQFSGYANFYSAQFSGEADFWGAQFSRDANFSGAQFAGSVYFNRTRFDRMAISWAQLEGRLAYDDWFYASLVRNFESLGQFDDADNAYLAYRVAKRDHETPFPHLYWFLELIFLDLTCGYGVEPFRAPLVALFLMFAFALGYYRTGAIRRLAPSWTGEYRNRARRVRDALYFSVTTFTTLGYGDWYPTEQPLFRVGRRGIGSARLLAMLEGLLGWLLLALFLVTLGNVWIR